MVAVGHNWNIVKENFVLNLIQMILSDHKFASWCFCLRHRCKNVSRGSNIYIYIYLHCLMPWCIKTLIICWCQRCKYIMWEHYSSVNLFLFGDPVILLRCFWLCCYVVLRFQQTPNLASADDIFFIITLTSHGRHRVSKPRQLNPFAN